MRCRGGHVPSASACPDGSKPELALGEDAALDFVGAGIDRAGAVIEVFGRGGDSAAGACLRCIEALETRNRAAGGGVMWLKGRGIGAGELEGEFGQVLAEFGAADFHH